MVYYHNIYKGGGYGLQPNYVTVEDPVSASPEYSQPSTSNIGLATDPRTANQLKEVSSKLNTGAKAIEVSFTQSDIFESVPKQHFEELQRLKKLVGAELTLHAPIVEPTGIIARSGWDEFNRKNAERQMLDAVEKGHILDPKGNTVITFHSSAVPFADVQVFEKKEGEEKGRVITKEIHVVDERTGSFGALPIRPSYFKSEEEKELKAKEIIKEDSEKKWTDSLQHLNFNVSQGENMIDHAIHEIPPALKDLKIDKNAISNFYKEYKDSSGKGYEAMKAIDNPALKDALKNKMNTLEHGEIYIRSAYKELQEMFDMVYVAAKSNKDTSTTNKLDSFRKEIVPKMEAIKGDPLKIREFAEEVQNGIHLLSSIKNIPPLVKPFREFALDKASDTFSNVAFQSYKKFGENTPIISIENPPYGTAALSRGEDLRDLVKQTREKFVNQAVKSGKLSKSEAEKEAEKLIGVTWDVGHINMLRKYGFGTEELKKEAEAIAKYAKHVHLSDNFGLEHTELPMGMGNVPMKEHLAAIEKYNKQVKKMIEVGNWYQHFQSTPFGETLSYFNSPVYSMQNAPYWSESMGKAGAYFAGYGMNPDVHHQVFGAGFSTLPIELGGQMSGKSRVSGTPMD